VRRRTDGVIVTPDRVESSGSTGNGTKLLQEICAYANGVAVSPGFLLTIRYSKRFEK